MKKFKKCMGCHRAHIWDEEQFMLYGDWKQRISNVLCPVCIKNKKDSDELFELYQKVLEKLIGEPF
ncbi:MAG: hypothetical protein Q8L90_15925 [Bacteroidota bacterium]|jgi:hypothetical protein|nr:hypothetical protein [Bacteroidia bacterium]MDP1747063.1 hypothetical protein [Bacteroidota bacterium]